MAKTKHTTRQTGRASVAKVTKSKPVEWGWDKTGGAIVTRARGKWAHELPVSQWRGMRATIADLQDVADGINTLRALPVADMADAMAVIAAHAISLIDDLAASALSILALSPDLRANIAKEDARMASKGGAA